MTWIDVLGAMTWVGLVQAAMGFFISAFFGACFAKWIVEHLRRLGGVPTDDSDRIQKFTTIFGIYERIAITAIAIYHVEGAAAFTVAWIGLKLASHWNRPGSISPQRPYETNEDAEARSRRIARGSLTAIIGSLVSAFFAFLGALYARGFWCILPC